MLWLLQTQVCSIAGMWLSQLILKSYPHGVEQMLTASIVFLFFWQEFDSCLFVWYLKRHKRMIDKSRSWINVSICGRVGKGEMQEVTKTWSIFLWRVGFATLILRKLGFFGFFCADGIPPVLSCCSLYWSFECKGSRDEHVGISIQILSAAPSKYDIILQGCTELFRNSWRAKCHSKHKSISAAFFS